MRAGALGLAIAGLIGCVGCTDSLERVEAAPRDQASGGSGVAGATDVDVQDVNQPVTDEDALAGTVLGKVSQTGPTLVVVDDADGRRFWLQITADTVVTQAGKPSSALAFRAGREVRVSFATDGGQKVLLRAEVNGAPPQ